MYDAIIVGARCAGSSTAMLLARSGFKVLLVDRARFPSDTISGHYIHPAGVAFLKRWGLLDRLATCGCPPISEVTFDVGLASVTGSPVPVDGLREGYGPRRFVVDTMLLNAAIESGVEFRERFTVEGLLVESDKVAGIRGRTKDGSLVQECASIVVGADGVNSIVARSTQATEYHSHAAMTADYYTYFSGFATERAELYSRNQLFIALNPTSFGLTLLIVLWPRHRFNEIRANVDKLFWSAIATIPSLEARVRSARREERYYGTARTQGFIRKSHGEGWALVGDAGYNKDPITAQGMTDAFRSAALLASAFEEGTSGRSDVIAALRHYEETRNRLSLPMFQHTRLMAALREPTRDMIDLVQALDLSPENASRFFGANAGTIPLSDFYSDVNLLGVMGRLPKLLPEE
jgi:2-polyprenyl-6-methoxyphenol hydroxylase-like FAD-dependent oxidoreductase